MDYPESTHARNSRDIQDAEGIELSNVATSVEHQSTNSTTNTKNIDPPMGNIYEDSAYASLRTGTITGGTQNALEDSIARPRGVKLPGHDLYLYRIPKDYILLRVYAPIQNMIEPRLKDEIKNAGMSAGLTLSTHLESIGSDKVEPTLRLLIMVSPTARHIIQRVFECPRVQNVLEFRSPPYPPLQYVIVDHGPKLRSAEPPIDVCCGTTHSTDSKTDCGASILFRQKDQENPSVQYGLATFGGLLKVEAADETVQFVGMTSGHAVDAIRTQKNRLQEEFGSINVLESWLSDHETIGHVIDSRQMPGVCAGQAEQSHDWAIISMKTPKPNIARKWLTAGISAKEDHPVLTPIRPLDTDPPAPALLLGPGRSVRGEIQSFPARFWVGQAERFVDAYMFELAEDEGEIKDGTSGAWVVHSAAPGWYGHVVATSPLGDVYVLSSMDTIANVRDCLGAKSVSLPTLKDVQLLDQINCSVSGSTCCSETPLVSNHTLPESDNGKRNSRPEIIHQGDIPEPARHRNDTFCATETNNPNTKTNVWKNWDWNLRGFHSPSDGPKIEFQLQVNAEIILTILAAPTPYKNANVLENMSLLKALQTINRKREQIPRLLQQQIHASGNIPRLAHVYDYGSKMYPERSNLTAIELYEALHKSVADVGETDHWPHNIGGDFLDLTTSRASRAIIVQGLDIYYIHALVNSAPRYSIPSLLRAGVKHLTLDTSVMVRFQSLSLHGYPETIFELNFHFRTFRLASFPVSSKSLDGRRSQRFFALKSNFAKGMAGIAECHVTVSICGTSERNWTCYAFTDDSLEKDDDDEYGDKEHSDGENSDYDSDVEAIEEDLQDCLSLPFSNRIFHRENHSMLESRRYFLHILSSRVTMMKHEWTRIIDQIELEYRNWENTPPSGISKLHSTQHSIDSGEPMHYIKEAVTLLDVLHSCLESSINAWRMFSRSNGDILYFQDVEDGKERHLDKIGCEFQEIIDCEKRLLHRKQRFQALISEEILRLKLVTQHDNTEANRLRRELNAQASKIALVTNRLASSNHTHVRMTFMMGQLYVPLAIAIALYTAEREVLPFKRTAGSFILTTISLLFIANLAAYALYLCARSSWVESLQRCLDRVLLNSKKKHEDKSYWP